MNNNYEYNKDKLSIRFPIIQGYYCEKCQHIWATRDNSNPLVCPKCKSPWWDKPRKDECVHYTLNPIQYEKSPNEYNRELVKVILTNSTYEDYLNKHNEIRIILMAKIKDIKATLKLIDTTKNIFYFGEDLTNETRPFNTPQVKGE